MMFPVAKPSLEKAFGAASAGYNFLNNYIQNRKKEASNEPGELPSIQSAQSDAGQFDLQAPNPGAAQQGAAQQGRYNPFEGQMITLPDGRVVPRTPENSLGGP